MLPVFLLLSTGPAVEELNQRLVAEGRMQPFPVVKHLDVLEADGGHFSLCRITNSVYPPPHPIQQLPLT